jgi:hypothetical protein
LCLSAKISFSSSMSGCRLSARTDETSVRQNAALMMPHKTLDLLIFHPSKLLFRHWRPNSGEIVKTLFWVIVVAR